MNKKTIFGLIAITIFLFFSLFLRQLSVFTFDLLIMLFMVVCTVEMATAFMKNGYRIIKTLLIITCILVYPMSIIFGIGGGLLTLMACFFVTSGIVTFRMIPDKDGNKVFMYNLQDHTANTFVLVYPIFLISLFIDVNHNLGGLLAILMFIFIPLGSDTFAQWFGKLWGKKKLVPSISPNKTVAGSVGAFFGATFASLVLFMSFEVYGIFDGMYNVGITSLTSSIWYSLPIYIMLGLFGGLTSQLGDLFASWLKRQFKLKDFSGFLPGHGGLMDRADSILATLPLIYLSLLVLDKLAL